MNEERDALAAKSKVLELELQSMSGLSYGARSLPARV